MWRGEDDFYWNWSESVWEPIIWCAVRLIFMPFYCLLAAFLLYALGCERNFCKSRLIKDVLTLNIVDWRFSACMSFRLESGTPTLSTCLLNQKLQMLNCCIERKIAREEQAKKKPADEEFLPSEAEGSLLLINVLNKNLTKMCRML